MISVIIPTYQHARTLESCLASLLTQTQKPCEIIVVDDGSTDGTRALVEKFDGEVLYLYQKNLGAPSARNAGAARAKGTFLLFCDADIILHADGLEKMQRTLDRHPEASFAYSHFLLDKKKFRVHPFDPKMLREKNEIHTTSLIRQKDFPGFDPSLKRFQDWDLWLTMMENGCCGIAIDEFLFEIQEVKGRVNISHWVPAFLYKIPWQFIGWTPKKIKDYEQAKTIILGKHK